MLRVRLGSHFEAYSQSNLLKRLGGDRKMVDILALVPQHDEQAVLAAIELTLEDGAPA